MGPKTDSLPLRYFRLPPAQPLRLALVDPTDRYLEGVKAHSVMPAVFSLLLPLPTAAFSTIMAKRKATAEELEARYVL